MGKTGIPFLSMAEISNLIETKQVSPVEVTEAYLQCTDDLEFKFNAYLTACRQQVLDQAREAETEISRGNYPGPMHRILVAVETASGHREWVRERLQDYGHDNRVELLTGSILLAQAYYKAQKLRSMLRQQVRAAFETYDLVVAPTSGREAVKLQDDPVVTSKKTASRLPFMRTNTFNLASATAISVPCGCGSQGLPIGLQIGGPPEGEAAVLKVGHAYEQATTWHTMRPPNA